MTPASAVRQVTIYISAYVEAANRDAFMAVKQDLLAAFVDCCERNGARLARNRLQARPLLAGLQPAFRLSLAQIALLSHLCSVTGVYIATMFVLMHTSTIGG